MDKPNKPKPDRSTDAVLKEAREIEEKKVKMCREGFMSEYNALVQKYGYELGALAKLVPAGQGILAIAPYLVLQKPVTPPNGQ